MTGKIEARLAELGITLPDASAPAANYLPYVQVGKTLYVSGQIPRNEQGLIVGKLGAGMTVAQGQAAAENCALSLLAQVRAACKGDLDQLGRVVKLNGYVNCTDDFTDQHLVINGSSDILVKILKGILPSDGKHARAAVGNSSLPLAVAVEVEGVFELK